MSNTLRRGPIFSWKITRFQKILDSFKIIFLFFVFYLSFKGFMQKFFPLVTIEPGWTIVFLISVGLVILGIMFSQETEVDIFKDHLKVNDFIKRATYWHEVETWKYFPRGITSGSISFKLKEKGSPKEKIHKAVNVPLGRFDTGDLISYLRSNLGPEGH